MNIPSKWRGYLYVVNIVAAVLALVLGVGIVLFGWVTEEQVMGTLAVAYGVYSAFIGFLARLNLTPPEAEQ